VTILIRAFMKILLLGKNGQVGWELQRSLAPLGELIALDRHSTPLCGDLSKPEALAQTVRDVRPDVIVNAAAHTAVDKAESEPELARTLNATAPAALAQAAADVGAWLVHYSTDYVFNGEGQTPWQEGDATGPLGVYGQTKLEGEQAIAGSGCKHLIFRTSWVYAARGGNFARTMLRLAQERERLTVIDDQRGAPTGADLIADVSAHAIRQALGTQDAGLSGIYHLVAAGETSWHGYASHAIERARQLKPDAGWKVTEIAPVPTSAFPTPARRPLNSRLNTQRLQQAFGLTLPAWQQGVDRLLAEML
jgi:dTDP-4-dehydrorhamnose reductase